MNPGFPASHGCIRVPTEFAKKLFAAHQPLMPVQQLLKLRHKCCGVRGLYSAHLLRCTLRLPLHR